MALANDEAALGAFPPAYVGNPRTAGSTLGVSYPDGNGNSVSGFAWGTLILPFVEQQPLSASVNFDLPCWAPDNVTSVRTKLSVFICPTCVGPSDGFALASPYERERRAHSGLRTVVSSRPRSGSRTAIT